jgi:hypothetical protein
MWFYVIYIGITHHHRSRVVDERIASDHPAGSTAERQGQRNCADLAVE